jgi:hypothetical protein
MLAAPFTLAAQSPSIFPDSLVADPSADGGGQVASPTRDESGFPRPFSRLALGAGSSTLGINLMAATNINRFMNLRASGNVFDFSKSDISISDFTVDFKLNMASAGVSLDFFPFPTHGLRISPGLLFYNSSGGTGGFTARGGSSFTLNNVTYYSSTSNPVTGSGALGLHTTNPAFTITTGWGNVIPHNGKHFSFPFEIGIAVIGAPTVNVTLNSGQVCNAGGSNCVNVATDSDVQGNLQEQIVKYRNDLNPLKTFPIISGGVAYSFGVH